LIRRTPPTGLQIVHSPRDLLGRLDRSRRLQHPLRRVIVVPLPTARPSWLGAWRRHVVTP
jgi:hypothetical protein